MPLTPNIEYLREDKDLEGLMGALRYPGNPTIRAQAALALGQLNDSLAVESLIRSSQLDPAAEVQTAARQALQEMFGGNAQNVIRAYPIYPDEAPWISEETDPNPEDDWESGDDDKGDEENDQEEDGQDDADLFTGNEVEGGWTADDLGALVTILRSERDPRLRLKAARALGHLGATNIHAVEALAATALWGEKPSIRAAALQALVNIYGDEETDRLLDTFREMRTLQVDHDADPEVEEDEEGLGGQTDYSSRQPQILPQPISYSHHDPVMQEEGSGHLKMIIWIGITLLIILGLILAFLNFR